MLIKKEILTVPQIRTEIKIDKTEKLSEDFTLIAHTAELPRSGKLLIVELYSTYGTERRFVTNGDSFVFYDFKTNEWNTRAFYTNTKNNYYSDNFKSDKNTRKTVLNYLFPGKNHKEYEYRTVGYLCHQVTTEKAAQRREIAAYNKANRIKRHVHMAAECTKEILEYCKERIFPHYIFYSKLNKGARTGKCSHCNKSFSLPREVKHRSETVCPKCGCQAYFWASQHYSSAKNKTMLTICREIDKQLIIAIYEVCIYRNSEGKYTMTKDKLYVRCHLKGEKKKVYSYKWKNNMYYGWSWYEEAWEPTMEAVVYPENLREIFGQKYHGIDMQSAFEGFTGKVNFVKLLDNLKKYPQTEYLVKIGLAKLASEMDAGDFGNGRNLTQVFGTNKSLIPLYIKREVTLDEHRMIQAAGGITDEQLTKLRAIKPKANTMAYISEILGRVSLTKLLNYLPKQKELYPKAEYEQIIRWYRDLLNMYDDLDIHVRKSLKCPKDLKIIHDKTAEQLSEIAAEREAEYLEIAKNILSEESANFSRNGFSIVMPKNRADFIREGQELHHCVGGSQYYENHISGERMIFFIRMKNAINEPFVTLQVDMKKMTLAQIYGMNDKPPAKAVKDFARKFITSLKKSKKKEDPQNGEKQNSKSKGQCA